MWGGEGGGKEGRGVEGVEEGWRRKEGKGVEKWREEERNKRREENSAGKDEIKKRMFCSSKTHLDRTE